LSASIAKEHDDQKIAASLKTAQDARDTVRRIRDSYTSGLTQFEKAEMADFASYADKVRYWLMSQSQADKTNRWNVVTTIQKDYAGNRMDNLKGTYATRLDHLQAAIKKMIAADSDSVALGNKSAIEDADKAEPVDAPVFEFVLPMTGDNDPVIFRNRGKDVRLSEWKKK
jgi:hypothetical protein